MEIVLGICAILGVGGVIAVALRQTRLMYDERLEWMKRQDWLYEHAERKGGHRITAPPSRVHPLPPLADPDPDDSDLIGKVASER